ncbi:DKNYY domain-containing protein [Flavitalea antarctica]
MLRLLLKAVLFLTGAMSVSGCGSGYKQKDGKTLYNGEEIAAENLVVLNNVFAKDDSVAYYRGRVIEVADLNTFEAIDENYAKDLKRVYFCEQRREGQTYFTTKKATSNIVDGADPETFESIGGGYAKDKSHVFLEGEPFEVKDIATFRGISLYFSRDDSQVYFHGKPVTGSDGKTFEVINNHYAKDNRHVYYYGYPSDVKNGIYTIPCKLDGFKLLEYPYSTDGKSVFYENSLISKANAEHFERLTAGFSKDDKSVFFETKQIVGADPLTIKVLDQDAMNTQEFYFAKDRNSAYFKNFRLSQADPGSFKVLGLGYAVDSSKVYYMHNPVNSADSKSFEVHAHGYGESDAKDVRNEYLKGQSVKN